MDYLCKSGRGLLVVTLMLFVAACDRNSRNDAIPLVQVAPPPPPVTMTIVPSLGLISGADAALSNVSGAVIEGATGITDANGQVQLSFAASEVGPFIVTISGSTGAAYFDEFLNDFVPYPEGSQLRAIIPGVQDSVGVTPLTEIAAARFVATGGTSVEDVSAANEAVRLAFLPGITDITAPPTVLTAGSDLLGDTEADIYATYLATLANLAPNSAAPALEVTAQLALDFSDGFFDTAVNGVAIEMPLFDNQSGGFNAQLNAALQSSLTRFVQDTVLASSFANVLGGGFSFIDSTDDLPVDDIVDTGDDPANDDTTVDDTTDDDNVDDGTTSPPPSSLTEGASRVASLAGSYTFLISQITDSSGQTAPNSNQVPGSTIDIVISNAGLVSFPSLEGMQQVDFNAVDNTFQESAESVLSAGFYRSITPVGSLRRSVFVQFKNQTLVGLLYQNFVTKDDGSSGISEIISVRQTSDDDAQFFSSLSELGTSTLVLVDKSDAVALTPYLCDQREYRFEVPTEIINKDSSSRINRSLPPLVITEVSTSLATSTSSRFNAADYQVSLRDDGSREMNVGTFQFVLADSSALSVNIRNNELSEGSLYTNDTSLVAALNCPASRSLVITETGLNELKAAGSSDGFVRLTNTITATGDIEGSQLSQPVFVADNANFDDVSSIEYTVPEGFDYAVALTSSETESEFCSFTDNAIGTMGSSDLSVELVCTLVASSAPVCPVGESPSIITQFPTRTSGDGDGVLQLTFAESGSPVPQGTDTRFTLSSSGTLFIDNVDVSNTPYFCPVSSQEILWLNRTNNIVYTMSLSADGNFREFNLNAPAGTFLGQYTDQSGDFSDLVYDLSTAQTEVGG